MNNLNYYTAEGPPGWYLFDRYHKDQVTSLQQEYY